MHRTTADWKESADVCSRPHGVTAYRAALPPGEMVEFAIDPLDRVDVPTWSAILYVHGQQPDGGGQGYGITDAAARIGAYGEMTEGVHAIAAMQRATPRRATYSDLVNELGERGVVDPSRSAFLPVARDAVGHGRVRAGADRVRGDHG